MSPTLCSIEGCDQEVLSRGWCPRHYSRWYRTGDPLKARKKLPNGTYTTCTVDGCEKPHWSGGLCQMHRYRLRTTGDVGGAEQTKFYGAKAPKEPCEVEGCDRLRKGSRYCHLHTERLRRTGSLGAAGLMQAANGTGTPTKEGYIRLRQPSGRRVLRHVLVMEEHLGRRLAAQENVHHINGSTSDDRIENLELWVSMQPSGQRVADLIKFIAEYHRDAMIAALGGTA